MRTVGSPLSARFGVANWLQNPGHKEQTPTPFHSVVTSPEAKGDLKPSGPPPPESERQIHYAKQLKQTHE